MAQAMFNIDQDVLDDFRKKHKGDMSKLVNDLIKQYIEFANENVELEKIEAQRKETEIKINELKKKLSNLNLLYAQAKEYAEVKQKEEQEESQAIKQWAKDCITDAKKSGMLTDLTFEAEKAGFSSVEKYLIDKWVKNGFTIRKGTNPLKIKYKK